MASFEFQHNKDLTSLSTFHLPARAAIFAEYSDVKQLTRITQCDEWLNNEVLHIGGGSNLLFLRDFNGLVLHSAIKGITFYHKDNNTSYAIAGAGESWESFVEACINEGLSGIENLAGIPGEVGAAPVQNVGAYGVDAADVIHAVECYDTTTRKIVRIEAADCGFGYRDSKFKHEWKGRYYVVRVSFRLQKSDKAASLSYGPLRDLESRLGHIPSPRDVANEVLSLRAAKLPDPKLVGSAGSFFKNPVVSAYLFREEIEPKFPDMPRYDAGDGLVKLSAAWMIDKAGMKGHRIGGAFIYPTQPLVIANDGTASARDVQLLAKDVTDRIREMFGISLHPEVNYIDSTIHVTILGSGTSKGIPEIGCRCPVCSSNDPRDKRLRASVLVNVGGMNILIDPSPDLRQQALRNDINHLDAILVTHSHYDHVGGFDDLRPLNTNMHLPVYLREDVNNDLHHRLDYCFRPHPYPGVPVFDMHVIENAPFFINGVMITPIDVLHGRLPIFGYRIGNFAYLTDVKTIDDDELEKLENLDVLLINALRFHPDHFAHLTVDEALRIIEKVAPKRAYLTHFCHNIGLHADLEQRLPINVKPLFDGLHIDID